MKNPQPNQKRSNIMKAKCFLAAAGVSLAMAFTLSCTSDGTVDELLGAPPITSSSSSEETGSSSSAIAEPSPTIGAAEHECPGNPQEYDPALFECRSGKNGVYLKEDFRDADGEVYEAVLIGDQVWMARNLNYAAVGSRCYGDNPNSCREYGRMYDAQAAKNVCPSGWHLPSREEWEMLIVYVGASIYIGDSRIGNGTKGDRALRAGGDYGLSLLMGGHYGGGTKGSGHQWQDFGIAGYFWTSTSKGLLFPEGTTDYIGIGGEIWMVYDSDIIYNSVRCVKGDLEGGYSRVAALPSSSSSGNTCGNNYQTFDPEGAYQCKPEVNPNGIFLKTPVTHEGEVYEAVLIGTQVWLARNLNVPHNEGNGESWCYEGDEVHHVDGGHAVESYTVNITAEEGCAKYGRLYDWAAAMDLPSEYNGATYYPGQITPKHRGLCPEGFHIPTYDEWDTLIKFAGNGGVHTQNNAGRKLRTQSGWFNCGPYDSGKDFICEDEFGFSALPGGCGDSFTCTGNFFSGAGTGGGWVTATERKPSAAYYSPSYAEVVRTGATSMTMRLSSDRGFFKAHGNSVRCVMD
jgi:uncharacterized protein (TIGR02145 family)